MHPHCGSWAQLPHSIWDLGSLTRDWTPIPCIGRQILNHWTTREAPWVCFLCLWVYFCFVPMFICIIFQIPFFLFSFVFARWIPQHMQSWSLIFLFAYCLFLKKRSLLETFEEIVEFHPFGFVLQELDVVLCVHDGLYLGCKYASCGKLKFVSWMQLLEFHSPELDHFQLQYCWVDL